MTLYKTSDEILLFLVKNATRDPFRPVEPPDPPEDENGEPYDPLRDLLLRLSGSHRYTVPVKDFEALVGEPYSFEKHLRAIHEAGHLRFEVPEPDGFYDTEEYREVFDKTIGLVTDYNKPERPSFVAFRFRCPRHDFLSDLNMIQANARKLGLVRVGYLILEVERLRAEVERLKAGV